LQGLVEEARRKSSLGPKRRTFMLAFWEHYLPVVDQDQPKGKKKMVFFYRRGGRHIRSEEWFGGGGQQMLRVRKLRTKPAKTRVQQRNSFGTRADM